MSIDWSYKSANLATFALPIIRYDETFEMSVLVTPLSTLQNAFLYTDSNHLNIITAKRSTQTIYQTVGVYSSSPSCFIGSLDGGVQTQLDVRLDFATSSLWGEQAVPIWVGSGENIEPLAPLYSDIFWKESIEDPPSLWMDNTTESSLWTWIYEV